MPFNVCIFALINDLWLLLNSIRYKTMSDSFGKRVRECREQKGFSQQELAKMLSTSYTVIGKYERDEMKPSIDAAKRIAKLIDTTVGYLLGESDNDSIFKDPDMLKRFNEINNLPEDYRKSIILTVDAVIRDAKTKLAYAH